MHRTSAPFLPQLNGFIERDNRTIMEAVRAMLVHRSMPEDFWGKAANVAVYTLKRVVNANTKALTPYELYFGSKPRVSHLRVLGSLCFVKAQEKKRKGYRKKLKARSTKAVFTGYDAHDFTYKAYDPQSKKFVSSRDIIFDETRSYYKPEVEERYDNLDALIYSLPEVVPGDETDDDHDCDDFTATALPENEEPALE